MLDRLPWTCLVEKSPCEGDTENYYRIDNPKRWTHVRLNIFPDGGVARFRVHGEVVVDPRYLTSTVDLLAQENGGRLLDTSDAFYSTPENLILTHRARLMGEGWENARRRGPGNDWALFRLGARGEPTMVEVDTSYFIGNAPGEVRVSAADETLSDLDDEGCWWDVVPRTPVLVDTRHRFLVAERRTATHLRLDVYPDGGLTRLRCFGELPAGGAQGAVRAVLGGAAGRAPGVPGQPRQRSPLRPAGRPRLRRLELGGRTARSTIAENGRRAALGRSLRRYADVQGRTVSVGGRRNQRRSMARPTGLDDPLLTVRAALPHVDRQEARRPARAVVVPMRADWSSRTTRVSSSTTDRPAPWSSASMSSIQLESDRAGDGCR